MESPDEEDDLKLVKASAGLLSDLESALPRLLWRPPKPGGEHGRVHTAVKQRDLAYIIQLIEPFQGEPQLLDARLKHIVPLIVEAYLEYLTLNHRTGNTGYSSLESAVCTILYTLCKVRGYKVIVGFFNNEARYLEPMLRGVERTVTADAETDDATIWQVHYVLLLWLSHLLLTPFDLVSISDTKPARNDVDGLDLPEIVPSVAIRCLQVGLQYLPVSTKAQDAAAAMLVRLVIRPDMQTIQLGDYVVQYALQTIKANDGEVPATIYERLGPLRLLAGIASSADLAHLIPGIYRMCEGLANDASSSISSNAVAKKLTVKVLRNIAMLCLRSAASEGPLLSFLETTSVLEDVIDYLLRSLGDRDTPVRYAAAKAMSLVVQQLEPAMGHEVVQAVLDTFKEDVPQHSTKLDFRTADPLRWHGLTLALAHILFKRIASPEQLPDIVNALAAALQFEQRTTTGSSMGTNVRDAANFGIWALSRRYTTDELLAVSTSHILSASHQETTVIQALATQLILSACLDPAGNIRRGSSAALQELVGRHPNQVHEGIALVQIVDYQAVGLRQRAMVDVVRKAAELHKMYWEALLNGVLGGWRGVSSPDVPSRQAAATSIACLSVLHDSEGTAAGKVVEQLEWTATSDAETLHGLVLSLASIVHKGGSYDRTKLWNVVERLDRFLGNFTTRIIRSVLPAAAAELTAALCRQGLENMLQFDERGHVVPYASLEILTERLLARQEGAVMQAIPSLVKALLALKRQTKQPLGCLGVQTLCKKVNSDSPKSTLGGAARVIALGALAPVYGTGIAGEEAAAAITTLASVVDAKSVDWRVIGVRALTIAVKGVVDACETEPAIIDEIARAVHRGMNDYTIDERGDVGSLVRLQAIACTSSILGSPAMMRNSGGAIESLRADVVRLSLEKLDRVRVQAAQCRQRFQQFDKPVSDLTSVSSYEYFYAVLGPLRSEAADKALVQAVIEGCVSCAGVSAESLLQASRLVLATILNDLDDATLSSHLMVFTTMLKRMFADGSNLHAALELLAFLLDMQIPQRLAESLDFKWRNLLSTVQKTHHKSNDIPKILAAVHVYRGLASVAVVEDEALKKLVSMLKTNPYPRVRASVAETLLVMTRDEALKGRDWAKPAAENRDVVDVLQHRLGPS